jgi:hypothetical protein
MAALRRGDAARDDLKSRGLLETGQTTHESPTSDTQATHNRGTLTRRDIRISDEDWKALAVEAERRGTSISAIIRELVRGHLRGDIIERKGRQ